jgi:hypothetical protein
LPFPCDNQSARDPNHRFQVKKWRTLGFGLMKHLFASVAVIGVSIVVLGAVLVLPAQAASTYQDQEHLTKKQLAALVAAAKTPAEHERIAAYYRAESERLAAEADQNADLAGKFLGNSATNNDKSARGTVFHCISVERNLRAKSVKARALAEEHQRIARGAERR